MLKIELNPRKQTTIHWTKSVVVISVLCWGESASY